MTIEKTKELEEIDEQIKKNHEISSLLLIAIDIALENPKNLQRLQQFWQANDPTYKKCLENKAKIIL